MTEFRSKPLDSLLDTLIDYRGKTPPKSSEGVRLVTAKCIKRGVITDDSLEYISEETYQAWMRRGLPSPGDVLITTEAPLGEVARVPQGQPIALAQRVILLRSDPAVLNIDFLYCAMRSPLVQQRLRQRSSGTTVSGIRQSELRRVEIPYPAPSIQIRVGEVIVAFDELIENNRRRIEILDEAARSLYREWFVHFRFPGHESDTFVDSPLGPIPHGWVATPLRAHVKVNPESTNPSGWDQVRYVDISGVDERSLAWPAYISGEDAPGRARRLVADGDVVHAMVRPNRRAHALVIDPPAQVVASTGLAVLRPVDVPGSYLYEVVSDQSFTDYLVGRATGAAYPAVKPGDFEEAPLLVPTPDLLERFAFAADPLHRLGAQLRTSITSLAAARDELLPKLVTGRIDVESLGVDDVFGWAELVAEAG